MTDEEWRAGIEARIKVIEGLADHIRNPSDREIDEYLRRTLKAMITFAWLVRHLTIFAGAIIAVKLALNTVQEWLGK